MSRLVAVLPLLLLFALLAGCGGSDIAYTEVKSDPATLPIPQDQGSAAAASSTAGPTGADGVTTKKTGATDTAASGTSTTGTTTTGTSTTGTTTAPSTTTTTTEPSTDTSGTTGGTTPTTPSTTTPPSSSTGGATADDQFCADNPGACNDGN
jgi:hypothetical protein